MHRQSSAESQAPTERVPAGRGMPLVVALGVVVALALLVAHPWEGPAPAPSPVALATATHPASPGATPLAAQLPTLTPSAPAPVLPPPDLGPLDAPGEVALGSEQEAGVVRCSYGRVRHGVRRLVGVAVSPPIVTLDANASPTDISHVVWRFVLQMNEQQHVFDREWLTVGASRMQATGTAENDPASFTTLELRPRVDLARAGAVYRVRLVIEWFTRNLESAGQVEVAAARYQQASASGAVPPWPYCAGALPSS